VRTLEQHTRRTIARICIAVSIAILLAIVAFPALRLHLPLDGWLTCVSAAGSLVAGLAYLRSSRGGAR
jgi:archaellum biogenesis protein FlaJ (TadC family)